jgi:dihydrofolate reductase
MKTILIFVSTIDGKITKWGDPMIRSWSSKDDQKYFDAVWNDTRVIIMGSGTYNPDPLKADPKHLYIVLTHKPSRYESIDVPGLLEFTNESPRHILDRFKNEENRVLIVGGSQIATSFLKEQLIDELWLTFEPKIFGTGANFVTNEKLDIDLRLISFEQINEQGTVLTKYKVLRSEKINNC